MSTLIVYDSAYGNTEQIAKAIGNGIGADAEVVRVNQVELPVLDKVDFLVVGAPTYGGRPTQAMQDFLARVPVLADRRVKVATFDTRLTNRLVGIFGYAAGKIAEVLKKKGGTLISPPEGFFVKGSKGPLKEGELDRAAKWGRSLLEAQKAR